MVHSMERRTLFVSVVLIVAASATGAAGSQAQPRKLRGNAAQVLVSWSPAAPNGITLRPSDPSNGNDASALLTWWMGFSLANISESASGITFTQNPHTMSLPPGPATPLSSPGTLDHVKHLAFTPPYSATAKGKVVLSIRMSSQSTIPKKLPYKVTKRNDDLRLAACAINFVDFTNMLVADTFVTNQGVWALYERLPFARSEGHMYAAFTMVKRIARRTSSAQVHDLKIKYDQSKNALEWWVDGIMAHKVKKVGFPAPHMRALLDLGGTAEELTLPSLQAGFGCFTLLDGADPNGPAPKNGTVGLLNLNPTAPWSASEAYNVPQTWQVDTRTNASAVNDPSWRLFGQGTSMTVSGFSVSYE